MGGPSYRRITRIPRWPDRVRATDIGAMPVIITHAGHDAGSRDLAALEFLLDAAGLPSRPARPDEEPLLRSGAGRIAPGGLRLPPRADGASRPADAAAAFDPHSIGDVLPFDLVGAVADHLGDRAHPDPPIDALDEHGRLRAASEFAQHRRLGRDPLVNEAVRRMAEIGRVRFGIEPLDPWPHGRVAAVGLSHDVDLPDRYAMMRDLARPWRFRRAPRTQLRAAWQLLGDRLRDPAPDDHWGFDELLAAEERAGVRSTFLFSVTPYHAATGSTLDPAYDATGRRFRRLYARLRAGGWEIGLHAGYRAWEHPDRFKRERERLAALSGTEIRGLRHHYWQLGPDVAATLRAHEAAGFDYDASIAFNDAPGYRRAVALPFHPYDATMQRPITTLQLPTTLMDGNLFYRPMTVDDAVAESVAQLETIIALHGLAVVDWHSHTAVPTNRRFAAWGIAYGRILDWITARTDLWVATLGEIAEWRAERSAELRRRAEAG